MINSFKVAKEILERMNVMKLWITNNDVVPKGTLGNAHTVSHDSQSDEPCRYCFSKDICHYLSLIFCSTPSVIWLGQGLGAVLGLLNFVLPHACQV